MDGKNSAPTVACNACQNDDDPEPWWQYLIYIDESSLSRKRTQMATTPPWVKIFGA
jgi:hypothetical protein